MTAEIISVDFMWSYIEVIEVESEQRLDQRVCGELRLVVS